MFRRIIVGLCFAIALSAGPRANATSTVIQTGSCSIASGAHTCGVTFGSNVSANNYIVAGFMIVDTGMFAFNHYTISISDTLGLTYNGETTFQHWNAGASRNLIQEIWAQKVTSSGADTVTVNVSAGLTASQGGAVFAFEVKDITTVAIEGSCANSVDGDYGTGSQPYSNCLYSSSEPFLLILTNDINTADNTGNVSSSNSNFQILYQNGVKDFFARYFGGAKATFGGSSTNAAWTNATNHATSSGWGGSGIVLPGTPPAGGDLPRQGCCTP